MAKPSFSRAAGFPGEWALKTSLEDGQLKLKAYPAVPDQQIYVHEPRFSPLNWKVIAVRGSEDEQVYRVNPTGTQLFFHGSDQWLTASVPLPRSSGQVQITLVDAPSGRQLARTSITLP